MSQRDEQTRRFDSDVPGSAGVARRAIAARPSAFAAATVGSTLFLVMACLAVVLSVAGDRFLGRLAASAEVLAVIRSGTTPDQTEALRVRFAALPRVAEARLVPVDAAVAGIAGAAELGIRQAPSVLRIRAADGTRELATWIEAVRNDLSTVPEIDGVRVDKAWIATLDEGFSRLAQAQMALRFGTASLLVLGMASIWFLAAHAFTSDGAKVGAYIVLSGLAIAVLLCLAIGALAWWAMPAVSALPVTRESWADLVGAFVLAGTGALAGNGFAHTRR